MPVDGSYLMPRSMCSLIPNPAQNGHQGREGGTYNEGESLLAAHGHVASDLLVTADTEGTHGVTGRGENGLLAGELLEHLKNRDGTLQYACKVLEDEC
eukprot:1191917-Prorocentrum_minimum.AAC.4